jgi:uncharacterized membrane protein
MTDHRPVLEPLIGLVALAVGVTALIKLSSTRPPDSAPPGSERGLQLSGPRHTARTVTIDAPRDVIYDTWRDPQRLASFMRDIIAVEGPPERPVWVLDGPDQPVRIATQLVSDTPGHSLTWQSVPDAEFPVAAGVRLRDAPGNRGTEVRAHLTYYPPYGAVGHWVARLRGTDPEMRGRQDLKRLKMLLETGEIATASNRRSS